MSLPSKKPSAPPNLPSYSNVKETANCIYLQNGWLVNAIRVALMPSGIKPLVYCSIEHSSSKGMIPVCWVDYYGHCHRYDGVDQKKLKSIPKEIFEVVNETVRKNNEALECEKNSGKTDNPTENEPEPAKHDSHHKPQK